MFSQGDTVPTKQETAKICEHKVCQLCVFLKNSNDHIDFVAIEKSHTSLLEIIANSDQRHGHEFDCNQEMTLVRGDRLIIHFN